jgi:outer membrane lipoprotein SlyB
MAYEANASTAKNLLVPGVAGFNMMKRLGYSAKYDAKKEKEQDGEKKASVGRGNKGETMSMLAYDIGLRLGFEKRAEDPGSILNDPRLAGALIGALGGGAVGAVLPGGKGKRGRRAATGALIGGLGGAGYGAFKNYQGSMQSRLAQEAQRAQMLEDGASDAADQYEMQLQSSEGERKRLADVMKQLEGRTIQQQELEQLKREAYDTVAQAGQLTDRATTAEATAAKAQRRAKLEAQLRDQQTTRPATTGDQLWVDTQNAAGKAMDTLDTVNQYRLLPARYATLPARVGATAVAKLIEAIKSMPKVEKPALRPARPEKKVTPKKY